MRWFFGSPYFLMMSLSQRGRPFHMPPNKKESTNEERLRALNYDVPSTEMKVKGKKKFQLLAEGWGVQGYSYYQIWLVGWYCCYLLPKQIGATSQIQVHPTHVYDRMNNPVYWIFHTEQESTNRPDVEWQYRFYAPSQGDCGIEVKSAFVADRGDWNIVMGANNDQITLYSVNIDGKHSF